MSDIKATDYSRTASSFSDPTFMSFHQQNETTITELDSSKVKQNHSTFKKTLLAVLGFVLVSVCFGAFYVFIVDKSGSYKGILKTASGTDSKELKRASETKLRSSKTAPLLHSYQSKPNAQETRQVIIIGGGPAAHTAAIYAARAEMRPLLFEGSLAVAGGQLMTTTDVENFPGFPYGVTGPDFMDRCRDQSEQFGTEIVSEMVESVDLSKRPFRVQSAGGRVVFAESLIVATGATAKRLGIKGAGEGEYWQRGVSACAVCDGALPIFRNKPLVVVGGGDSAMEEASFLSKFASKVFVVHRRDELKASRIMQTRAMGNQKIVILYSHVVKEVKGNGQLMQECVVTDLKTGKDRTFPAAGLFFAIGHQPNTVFLRGQLKCDDQGYIATEPGTTKTSVAGVFACGDVQDKRYRQAITAAGSGCMAALDAEHFLQH
jgi:thioredoxin reductase (NADPH)